MQKILIGLFCNLGCSITTHKCQCRRYITWSAKGY